MALEGGRKIGIETAHLPGHGAQATREKKRREKTITLESRVLLFRYRSPGATFT
jgi:hypothetical protein